LQSLCVGRAANSIKGLGGTVYMDRTLAYQTAWKCLEQIFGDCTLLSQMVQDELLDGPAIELYDAANLAALRDQMFECESTYAGCGRLSQWFPNWG